MYQNVDLSKHAPHHVTLDEIDFESTSEERTGNTSPVPPPQITRPTGGALVPMRDVGLIDSSDDSDSVNGVERTLSRWLDYRDCAVVPLSQQNTPASLHRDTMEDAVERVEKDPLPRDGSVSSSSTTSKNNDVTVNRTETISFDTLEGAIVPLSEAADDVLNVECSSSMQMGKAPESSPLDGAVVPLAEALDEVDDAMDSGATVRRVCLGSDAPIVSKRDSATEVDDDYSRDIAGVVEFLVTYYST